jgi:hypothetical protein
MLLIGVGRGSLNYNTPKNLHEACKSCCEGTGQCLILNQTSSRAQRGFCSFLAAVIAEEFSLCNYLNPGERNEKRIYALTRLARKVVVTTN